MDTAKDARVLLFEDAIKRINDIVGNRKLKIPIEYGKLAETLKRVAGLIYEIKYSYIDPKALAELEPTKKAVSGIKEVGDSVHAAVAHAGFKPKTVSEQVTYAEVEYALRTVAGFPRRLMQSGDDPAHAVDAIAVEISQVKPVEGSSKLSLCRCTDGTRIWNIVTNITGLKPGWRLVCAVLPPVEMMGQVSEAMFLGAEPVPSSIPLGLLASLSTSALDQARAHVLELTRRMT